eukprot:6668721-Ditylum_brightwellii.AAC.1
MHVVGNKDNGVDNGVDNSVDSANKQSIHLSQAVDCCLMERSKQKVLAFGNKDNGVDDNVVISDDSANKHLTRLKNWMIDV